MLPELQAFKVLFYAESEGIENINFLVRPPPNDVDVAETRLLSHKTRKSVKRCDNCKCTRNKKVTGGGVKIDTDDDNSRICRTAPLRVEIPKFACGVRSPT